ncbi:portal protein, partial [Escherichia coli]
DVFLLAGRGTSSGDYSSATGTV